MSKHILSVVIKKEIKALLRDKRIMCLVILLPLLLAPGVMTIARVAMQSSQHNAVYHIAIDGSVFDMESLRLENNAFQIEVLSKDQANEKIKKESIDVFITRDDDTSSIKLMYNSASTTSATALSLVTALVNDQWEQELSEKLYETYQVPLSESKVSYYIIYEDIYGNEYGSTLILLIPMVILAYCCYGVSSVSGELTVAEWERGTFEPLLATGVAKSPIIVGKNIVAILFGWASGFLAFFGLYAYSLISGTDSIHISNIGCVVLVVVAVLIALFFSAISVFVGVAAKSYKEYQAFSSVMAILSMLPTFFTISTNIQSVPSYYYMVPLLGHTMLIKSIITGSTSISNLGITFASTLLVAGIAVILSNKAIKKRIE